MRGPRATSPRSQPDLLAAVPAPLRQSVLSPRVLRSRTWESSGARLLTRRRYSPAAVPSCREREARSPWLRLRGARAAAGAARALRSGPGLRPEVAGRAPRAVTCGGGANRRGRDVSARQLRGCGAGSGRSGMARRRRAAWGRRSAGMDEPGILRRRGLQVGRGVAGRCALPAVGKLPSSPAAGRGAGGGTPVGGRRPGCRGRAGACPRSRPCSPRPGASRGAESGGGGGVVLPASRAPGRAADGLYRGVKVWRGSALRAAAAHFAERRSGRGLSRAALGWLFCWRPLTLENPVSQIERGLWHSVGTVCRLKPRLEPYTLSG